MNVESALMKPIFPQPVNGVLKRICPSVLFFLLLWKSNTQQVEGRAVQMKLKCSCVSAGRIFAGLRV